MNRTDNRATIFPGEVTQNLHHVRGGEGIETGCWLIEENETGVGDQLDTDGGSLTLAAGDTLDERSSDSGVLALCQLKICDKLFDARHLHWEGAWKLEFSREL